jgi:enamine deaminase RidA (YjgF/YER057c/UK114 family)
MANAAQRRAGDFLVDLTKVSPAERAELAALGMIGPDGRPRAPLAHGRAGPERVPRSAITAPQVLKEAYEYARPSAFSRGLRIDLGDHALLMISGTASVDEEGRSIHVGDFRAQCWRTYRNITALLASEGATWHDVVKATCYLRDIGRDYQDFNEVRTAFFTWLGLDPLPASVGVQARLCRDDLLVEIEALAILRRTQP